MNNEIKPQTNLKQQTGLTKYTVLPPDFKLEVRHLPNGCIETNPIGRETCGWSWGGMLAFTSTLTAELSVLFKKHFDIDASEIITLGDYSPEGAQLVYIRSTVPPRKGQTIERKQQDLGFTPDPDFIDVSSTPSAIPTLPLLTESALSAAPKRRSLQHVRSLSTFEVGHRCTPTLRSTSPEQSRPVTPTDVEQSSQTKPQSPSGVVRYQPNQSPEDHVDV